MAKCIAMLINFYKVLFWCKSCNYMLRIIQNPTAEFTGWVMCNIPNLNVKFNVLNPFITNTNEMNLL